MRAALAWPGARAWLGGGWQRLAVALALGLAPDPGFAAQWLNGTVVGIADGDTLTVLSPQKKQERIRLSQIDAPELRMPFGRVAKKSLSDAVYRKRVKVRVDGIDRYGRVLGTVYVGKDDINLRQVRRGYAWVYRQYAWDPAYPLAENAARRDRLGLWAQAADNGKRARAGRSADASSAQRAQGAPVPPWQWRRDHLSYGH